MAGVVLLSATYQDGDNLTRYCHNGQIVPDDVEVVPDDAVKVGCITCPTRAHRSNMVNVYDGEYQCQECRWGL